MRCPICESNSPKHLTKNGCVYNRCSSCEFLFHRTHPSALGRIPAYDERYWKMERTEALRREQEDGFLRALELLYLSSVPVNNILDFGCGLGMTVRHLREELNLNAIGVDVSAVFEPTDYLHQCTLEEVSHMYPAGYFDAVYSIEVFEHLEDPRGTMSLLHKLVKPGGKILVNTGTQEYIEKHDPAMDYVDPLHRGHISIYSMKSLAVLASFHGYTATFLPDREHMVIFAIPGSDRPFPHPDNLVRMRNIGEWLPMLLEDYMRLVDFSECRQYLEELDKGLRLPLKIFVRNLARRVGLYPGRVRLRA
jgi:SAM-dependent methyltransferase